MATVARQPRAKVHLLATIVLAFIILLIIHVLFCQWLCFMQEIFCLEPLKKFCWVF
jgi:hypothetical protein